ncbi:MAG TPA: hypothetical protein VIX91_15285 [Candidatus Acidoferrum sp.]
MPSGDGDINRCKASRFCSSCEVSDRNYVASGAVRVRLPTQNPIQRHITPDATEEIKLDGYRAEAVKSGGNLSLLSRRQKSFSKQFPLIHEALADLPDNTVIDGEIVAMDESGRPNFNLLQSFRSAAKQISYFMFDLPVFKGQDLTSLPLTERRKRLQSLKFSSPLIRICEQFESSTVEMIASVRQLGLEGVIGKRKDSKYEAGKRTGSWIKHRINRGQELVIGGYFPGHTDSIQSFLATTEATI